VNEVLLAPAEIEEAEIVPLAFPIAVKLESPISRTRRRRDGQAPSP